jgi:Holliday junction DNA helicase RuvA
MIGHLTGKIIYSDLKFVILDVAGVGYKINTNTAILSKNLDEKADFWTYLAVRETALDLYGFQTHEELDFFELLLTVSGIGPKSAIGILSLASISNLRQAISTGDTSHLTKVSGIGKKAAEKIVVELKDKIGSLGDNVATNESLSGDIDALEALKSLGYSEREAREALKKVTNESEVVEKVKKALKILS